MAAAVDVLAAYGFKVGNRRPAEFTADSRSHVSVYRS